VRTLMTVIEFYYLLLILWEATRFSIFIGLRGLEALTGAKNNALSRTYA
jgi:hypothetical protein